MSTLTAAEPTTGDGVAMARSLSALIEEKAADAEHAGAISDDVVEALRESGLFWILAPEEYGGGGTLAEALEVTEELSRADASTGWTYMCNAFAVPINTGLMPSGGVERLYGGDRKYVTAAFAAPSGTARRVEGGYMTKGRWSFGSASSYSDFVGGGVQLVDESGTPIVGGGDLPEVRVVYFPADAITRLGNWDVPGLRATSSIDFAVTDELFVPEHMAFNPMGGALRAEGIFKLGVAELGSLGHSGVALGVMRRGLEEVIAAATGKQRLGYASTIDEDPVFLKEFAVHEAAYRGARAYLMEAAALAEEDASRNDIPSPEFSARIRQAVTFTHHTAERVVSFARVWSGSQAFRNPGAMERVVRDTSMITQHQLVDTISLVQAAPAILESYRHLAVVV